MPVTATELQQATRCDPVLGNYTKSGWPSNFNNCLKPFYNCKDEFNIENNCLLWEIHVVSRPYVFLLIDAHSKWPEIFSMSSTSCTKTIESLKHVFSLYGLPN